MSFFGDLLEWDPYTPLDFGRDVILGGQETVRHVATEGADVGEAVAEQLPEAGRKAGSAFAWNLALGTPVAVGGIAAVATTLYVVFVDPGLPGRTFKRLKG